MYMLVLRYHKPQCAEPDCTRPATHTVFAEDNEALGSYCKHHATILVGP